MMLKSRPSVRHFRYVFKLMSCTSATWAPYIASGGLDPGRAHPLTDVSRCERLVERRPVPDVMHGEPAMDRSSVWTQGQVLQADSENTEPRWSFRGRCYLFDLKYLNLITALI